MSYGVDWPARLTRTADYVARMLGGASPATMRLEQPTRFELVVNEGVARRQGISLPQSIRLQATELIR
jgi:putative tryptophan/tyrosine transport system substrate-binding protein